MNMDRTWMKEKITMSYEDLFNYVIQSRVLGDMLNENKLAEVGFEIPHLVYIQKNNKSPYMETEKSLKKYYILMEMLLLQREKVKNI